MKITIEAAPPDGEEEIIIRSDNIDGKILELIAAIKSERDNAGKAVFRDDKGVSIIDPREIFYFESVDERVFAYGESDVTELKCKLYEVEERFAGTDFIRISKSMIVNLSKVKRFAPYAGGRFEAVLLNGEKVVISRMYVPDLKKRLGI